MIVLLNKLCAILTGRTTTFSYINGLLWDLMHRIQGLGRGADGLPVSCCAAVTMIDPRPL